MDKKNELSKEEVVEFTARALGMQGLTVDKPTMDRIIMTIDRVYAVGSGFSINDAVHIETELLEKYPPQTPQP